jgi:hypothetical protein
MGRTMPSFRLALAEEEREWKPFRNSLNRHDRKEFDSMFADARLYISACSYAAKPVRIQPIMLALVFHHYKQLARIAGQLQLVT